jgi:hypothetical protein
MVRTFGVLGSLGVLILLVWAVGWLVLGYHTGHYHLLFPIGVLLCIAQGVRRIAA